MIAQARIPELGADNGILIFKSFETVRHLTADLVAAGYAYSILSEPTKFEKFDINSYREMFVDWGWKSDNLV